MGRKFDEDYILLEAMAEDPYFPDFLVEKVRDRIRPVVALLEKGESDIGVIQSSLDEMTLAINGLQEEFEENDSEIETGARESIAATVEHILKWFAIEIDIEDAIAEREW